MLTTNRLKISPISINQLKEIVNNEKDQILKQAYQEMLDGCLNHPENHLWHTLWMMELKESGNEVIGNLSFKGLPDNGIVEIGYGMQDDYKNQGYMTEAVDALVKWASEQPGVKQIEAEAEETNHASIRVLEKCNFIPNGKMGEEGIRFVWNGKHIE